MDSLEAGYQVHVSDVNGDGIPDVIALSTTPPRLVWYENPTWTAHDMTRATDRNIDAAPYDIDGDGRLDVALASGFDLKQSSTGGYVHWLRQPANPAGPWPAMSVGAEPTSHRLRWVDFDGDGRQELLDVPLLGPGAVEPDYDVGARISVFRIPAAPDSVPWVSRLLTDSLHMVHGVAVLDWNGDGRDDVLTASFEGITLFVAGGSGTESANWTSSRIGSGHAGTRPEVGSSEVAVGSIHSSGRRFVAAIEPWHGHEVVVYDPDVESDGPWTRTVIDDSFVDGHALATADLDGDGDDEIIAGHRGVGFNLFLYDLDPVRNTWHRVAIDAGGMSAAGVDVSDLNADGRPDVVAIGSRTDNVVWYENPGPTGFDYLMWSRTRTYVIVEKGTDSIGFYNGRGRHLASVPVGRHPHEIAPSADGRLAYVTDNGTMRYRDPGEGGTTISVVDLHRRTVVDSIRLDPFRRPHGIALDPVSGLLVVTTENPPRLLVVDPKAGTVIEDYDVHGTTPHMAAVSRGGDRIYVSNTGSGTIAAVDRETATTTVVPVGVSPQGLALTLDGTTLYVACGEYVSVVDTRGLQEVARLDVSALRLALTSDGGRLVIATRERSVAIVDTRTGTVTHEVALPLAPYSLSLSGDGFLAFAAAEPQNVVYAVSLDDPSLVYSFATRPGSRPDPVLALPGVPPSGQPR